MTDHDQLFKNLFQEFFGDLLRIVAPELAQRLRIEVFEDSSPSFSYLAFGLSRSEAPAYLARPEPLAWGLAGLMKPGSRSAARHKLACLTPITNATLTDRQRVLLINCIETYVE